MDDQTLNIPGAGAPIDALERFTASGVQLEHNYHGGICFQGRREALIAAGLARAEWFPDDAERDRRGRVVRTRHVTIDGRNVRVEAPAVGCCKVFICCTEEEKAQRRAREIEERDRREAYDKRAFAFAVARAEETKALAALPSSAEAFRSRSIDFYMKVLNHLPDWLDRGDGGYYFDAVCIEEANEAIDDLREVLLRGRVRFDLARRAHAILEIRSRTARADPGLQGFLDQVSGNAGAASGFAEHNAE